VVPRVLLAWRVSTDPIEDVGRLAGVAVDEVARVVGPECPGELELGDAERVLFAGV
jgi:hypothetical protein